MSSSPPDGVSVRQATDDDASAVDELIKAADTAVQGWSESSVPELLGWWRIMDLDHDSWLLYEGNNLVAYAAGFAHSDTFELDGFVHPEQRGRGFGSWLVARGEERARKLAKRKLQAFSLAGDDHARRLFEQVGMSEVRRYYRMMIELDGEPPESELPDGLVLETFDPKDAKAFHDALIEAFEDEWNFVAKPFERWREMRLVKDPDFDPTLWFVVWDGGVIAAVMRNEPDRSGAGFVGALGVRKPWRRRGIAQALLQHAFAEFYRRGKSRVALGVDAENPTAATRLYERAGMNVAFEAVAYGKELAA